MAIYMNQISTAYKLILPTEVDLHIENQYCIVIFNIRQDHNYVYSSFHLT